MDIVIFAEDGTNVVLKHNVETKRLFDQAKQVDREMQFLCFRFSHQDVNMEMADVFEFDELVSHTHQCFEQSGMLQVHLQRLAGMASADQNFDRSPYKVLQSRKAILLRQNLKRHQFQLIYQLRRTMGTMLSHCDHTEMVIEASLKICCLLNEALEFITSKNVHKSGGAQMCSNTFPAIMTLSKKLDIGVILQIVSQQRSEQCCLQLITCLIAGYRAELSMVHNQESDTSSVEILRTITHNLQSPVNGILPVKSVSMEAKPKLETVSQEDDPSINFFDNLVAQLHNNQQHQLGSTTYDVIELLQRLLHDEENFMANVMIKCIKICPSVFEKQLSREDLIKCITRGSRNLWTQVGGMLDHVLLWWSKAPVASQPTSHAKYLRDWLLVLQSDDAPEPILSTLKRLGESLTMHVSITTWDRQFTSAIVTAALLPIDISLEGCPYKPEHHSLSPREKSSSTCGLLWRDVLSSLIKLANSCDIGGTIPNELPIVEQIPILHRLDHSIHTMRLWAAEQSKAQCTDWNMLMFFKVVHGDIGNCLEQLADLRVPAMVQPGPLDVHIQVCVSLRAKLVSEIKINIEKLKKQTGECIEVLANVCMTCSLATLSLCFPPPRKWQCEVIHEGVNDYVKYYLDQIYLPVLQSGVQDYDILGLILKIMCEAWLDHIYASRTKFSRAGALNLLRDFDGVSDYIRKCPFVPKQHVDKLSKHEVLRMCEGVGKILLRKPQDLIPMTQIYPRASAKRVDSEKFADAELMDERPPLPPEMFVPNQKRWLELRAKDRNPFSNLLCLCSSNTAVQVVNK